MKKRLLLFVALISLMTTNTTYAQKIKVACIGNSITFGAGIANREKNSYPAQLAYRLGDDYDVKNFGVSGRTLLKTGDLPYVNTAEYKNSLDFQPNIVLIKLGTNDTKQQNRGKLADNFKKDYQELIDSYKKLASKPRIILLKPVPYYGNEEVFAGANQIYDETIIPAIEALAYENSLETIDLYHAFNKEWDGVLFPDQLHPSSLGATVMADRIAQSVLINGEDFKINIKDADKEFNFHGYKGYQIGENKVVEPRRAAKGNPWVIRARFWGHEPQTDIALLEKGFHITYCDVANMYGSPAALKKYDNFYKELTAKGLNKRVVLEGMSRGGLIVFNWAAKNTDKVAAIYADAPVLDFKSWPMGLGKSNGSETDTELLLKAYGFKNKEQAIKWAKNPIDQTKMLSKIPILLVVGDVDVVVPIAENSDIFEKNIPNIKVIHKPNVDHHPHSLYNPQPIVEFILKNCGMWQNPATIAVPGSEYRSGAGWLEGNDWHSIAQEISDVLQNKQVDVLFIGNSITQSIGSHNRKQINTHAGIKYFDEICNSWESAGISGDRTQNVLWRLKTGNYHKANPKKVFITIGVNNIASGRNTGEEVAEGIIEVVKEASKQFPNAQIYTFGMYPVDQNKTDKHRIEHNKAHAILAESTMPENVKYINLETSFCNPDGTLKNELYSGDLLHLSPAGYQMLAQTIAKLLK